MTPEQSRGARGLKDWSQSRLAEEAKVGLSTVRNFEAGRSIPVAYNLNSMRAALEAAGVIFLEANGGGPGVRLRSPAAPVDDAPKPVGPATDAIDSMEAEIAADRAKRGK